MIETIILFFILIFGLGYTVLYSLNLDKENGIESILLYITIGVAAYPIIVTIFHILHIPIYWWLHLILFSIIPVLTFKSFIKKEWRFNKSHLFILVVLLVIIAFGAVYLQGAFSYQWLEDDDPWSHATATEYISHEYTAWEQYLDIHYIDPYPPAYDILMGTLHQVNNSVSWTLKFFNVLLLSLGLLFFFMFAKIFFKDDLKATVATIILAVIPCFMSHFIWSQTLGLILFFPALYCLERTKENMMWGVLASIITASVFVAQPSCAVIFLPFVACYIIFKDIKLVIPILVGGLISGVYWGTMFIKYGISQTLNGIGFFTGLITAVNQDTSGGLIYGWRDFFLPPLVSKMDQPIGLGVIVCILTLFAIVMLIINFKRITPEHKIMGLWLLLTFIGVQGNALPFKLFPHRFWPFLAIAVVLLAAEGISILANNKYKYLIVIPIVLLIVWNSGYPKYVVETSMWPAGVILANPQEVGAWVSIKDSLPIGSSIFHYGGIDQRIVAGFDFYSCGWCKPVIDFSDNITDYNLSQLYQFLKDNNYEYVIFSTSTMSLLSEKYTQNVTNKHMNLIFNQLQNETLHFTSVLNTNSLLLLKVE